VPGALLFDLDDTLVPEEAPAVAAFAATARLAPGADAARLADLRDRPLVLVTNGAGCLQREKLEASGLAGHFDAVVVSADVGVGKPDPAVFRHALGLVDAAPDDALMISDTLERDVDGALAAGLRAVWVDRFGRPGRDGVTAITRSPSSPRSYDAYVSLPMMCSET
jgi:HAD superfamily hydrolase (TIGR01509 family)